MLSEISLTDKDKDCMFSLIHEILKTKQISVTKWKQTHRHREKGRKTEEEDSKGP